MGGIVEQAGATFGHHHRIGDQRDAGRLRRDRVGDHADHLFIVQHAGFQAVGADIIEHDRHLLGNEPAVHRMDGVNAQRVLRRQRGNRGHGEAAERAHRLDVGLNAGTAAGIGAGDDQYPSVHGTGCIRLGERR